MSVQVVALIWVIVFALVLMATAVINLRATNPRARGIQLATLVVVLALITVAFEAAGFLWAGILLAVAGAAEIVHLVRKRRRMA
jgi:uncharacterized membrane protein